jgi:hypothetical protein
MANFFRVPGGQSISNTTIVVNGTSLVVGLNGTKDASGNDLVVTNGGDDLSIFPGGPSGGGTLYTIRASQRAISTKATITDTIYATGDLGKPAVDQFQVEFHFHMEVAHELIVRDMTQEIFGITEFRYQLGKEVQVNMALFKPGDQSNVLDFVGIPGSIVKLRLFAAKAGSVERSYWLMLPDRRPDSLMVVISHGFGQNARIYGGLGWSNPLSKPLLEDVRDRFVLSRWGLQVAAKRPTMGLLLPVRAGAVGGELGPFITQPGMGAKIITTILAQADVMSALNKVSVVTFSSGIYDANSFITSSGRGLHFDLMVNQDPAQAAHIAGANRKQYLSGYTASGPRAGFEFLPKPRWQKDPKHDEMVTRLGREYLHTWALPNYTLAMALS